MSEGNTLQSSGPMRGVRVLDISNVIAGPFASTMMGDYGADVVKVEHPDGGDTLRHHGPSKDGVGLFWKFMGRNKRSVGLKLSDPDAAEVFLELVRTADILVENFRPGTLERWNLAPERLWEVNPGLVILRISGFGQGGPYKSRPAFGTMAEVMSGFANVTGQADGPPTLPPFGLADCIAGMGAVFAALMALREREVNGGSGQIVDCSILEPIMATMGFQIPWFDQLGIVETRRGNRSVNTAPRNTYLTSDDKWIAVAASTNPIARRLMHLIGHPEVAEEEWFDRGGERAKRAAMLDELLSEWAAKHTREEILRLGEEHQVAIAPVYDASDIVEDPQINAMNMIVQIDDEDLGPLRMQNVLFRMSETPGSVRFGGARLGQHTEEVLVEELGVDPDRIEQLRNRGVLA